MAKFLVVSFVLAACIGLIALIVHLFMMAPDMGMMIIAVMVGGFFLSYCQEKAIENKYGEDYDD